MSGINLSETIVVYPESIPSTVNRISESLERPDADVAGIRAAVSGQIEEIESLLAQLLFCQMRSMGAFGEPDFTPAEIMAKTEIIGLYDRWLVESLTVLARRGYLSFNGARGSVTKGLNLDIEEIWGEWELKKSVWLADPNKRAQVDLAEAMVRALPEILVGKLPAHAIMFPNSSIELVEGVYKHNPIAAYFNDVLSDALVSYIRDRLNRDGSTKIRILEIGAGTGGTSARVFAKVRDFHPYIQEYCYTDLSKAFLINAERQFGHENPFLTYKICNIEKPVGSQGIGLGDFDVVIATNVLHATKNIRQTVRNAKAALRKHGLLLLNEISGNNLYSNLTFGLLEGWWLYEDSALRIPGCPGISPEHWRQVLESEGFGPVVFPARAAHDLGQQIIVSESNGVVRQGLEAPSAAGAPPVNAAGGAGARPKPLQNAPGPVKQSGMVGPRRQNGETSVTDQMVEQFLKSAIRESISKVLKISEDEIQDDWSFSEYGVDSILAVNLVNLIGKQCDISLDTTTLFDHNNVNRLSQYIFSEHNAAIIGLLQENPPNQALAVAETRAEQPTAKPETPSPIPRGSAGRFGANRFRRNAPDSREYSVQPALAAERRQEPIAIIGMSGRFPKSDSVDALWQHLAKGDDLVEKASRWGATEEFRIGQVTYSNQGSFLDDIDKFDPLVFNISGLEASYMDPQQRIFLEEAWRALEDAGYAGKRAQDSACGVYVGCATGDYEMLLQDNAPSQAFWGNAGSIISSRIAYYLNLLGPAISIDTACSSSLVAVHLACQALWSGEIDMALAGGVYINATPRSFLAMQKMGMVSPSGRCYSFDDRADGFVLGEGVGVLVFKRLSDALSANDHIHGVIKGSGMNQDGTTNGITAPSAAAQERLERHVYETFKINPEHIQMVEAHGTGTVLGDPIEFNALTKAFRHFTDKQGFCAIGSIKSNMGHAAKAAGVVGIIKILLALRHRQIPASINFQSGNRNIQFGQSPFYVNTALRDWAVEPGVKRTAVTSAFGFSGTNVHVVIEEAPAVGRTAPERPGYIIALSASTAEQLRQKAEQLLEFCQLQPKSVLGDISQTLLLGRKHFDHRLACVARSQAELVKFLKKWLEKGKLPQVYAAKLNRNEFRGQASLEKYGNQCILDAQSTDSAKECLDFLSMIADLYVQGYALEYEGLFTGGDYRNIPLPTYPFAKERYWVPDAGDQAKVNTESSGAAMHPLLHRNTSDFFGQRFSSTFSGSEFFLKDHVARGMKLMPGMAYLEMARCAIAAACGGGPGNQPVVKLRNIAWVNPVIVDHPGKNVHVSLFPSETGEIGFEIFGDKDAGGAEPATYCQGSAEIIAQAEAPILDMRAVQSRFVLESIDIAQYYASFRAEGMNYGPAHQGIQAIYLGQDQVLAKLALPGAVKRTDGEFVLHPSLMDSAVQAIGALLMMAGLENGVKDVQRIKPAMPFALGEVEIFAPCATEMWAVVGYCPEGAGDGRVIKFNVDLCDLEGRVCVSLREFASILLDEASVNQAGQELGLLLLRPGWEKKTVPVAAAAPIFARHLIFLCETGGSMVQAIQSGLPQAECRLLESVEPSLDQRYGDYATRIFHEIQNLVQEKSQGNALVQVVVPARGERECLAGVSGMLKSARQENPRIFGQTIVVEEERDLQGIVGILSENSREPRDGEVRYEDGVRHTADWQEMQVKDQPISPPWRKDGIYLVTGGGHGLGLLFAEEIARQAPGSTIVLTGRSAPSETLTAKIEDLRRFGGTVEYRPADIGQKPATASLINGILADYGRLDGLVHSAGVIHDNFILLKNPDDLRRVFAPKVSGSLNLDEATKDCKLDFMILFSSLAGAMGNASQSDYAAANAFMDRFAQYRNQLVAASERRGHTLAVNWPLWRDGGMQARADAESIMMRAAGMTSLRSESGFAALYAGLAAGASQMLVFEGQKDRMLLSAIKKLANADAGAPETAVAAPIGTQAPGEGQPDTLVIAYLKDLISSVIGFPVNRIGTDDAFEKFGIDSLMVMKLTNQLESAFGSLSKTLFFEYQSVRELAGYFLQAHPGKIAGLAGPGDVSKARPAPGEVKRAASTPDAHTLKSFADRFKPRHSRGLRPMPGIGSAGSTAVNADIAIIGIAGKFPKAANVSEYWHNLREGLDCVSEIPADRWDYRRYYDEDKSKIGKTNCKWGGFIDGIYNFDPLFFNISPLEAGAMDPQERLFLQCAYETLEDAGYTRQDLESCEAFGLKGNVGVFAGVMYEEYQLYGAEETLRGRPIALSGNPAGIANRVSYFLNLHGPSLSVDSMCSSSLTTIHLACQSIRQGECQMALAGGVNLSVHPNKYLTLGQGKFASSNGRCESFGKGGDGYVPGEGVGAVLLKPLAKAIADGDRIYGVVKGTAINHGGKTNGYTVPNPNAQASVIGQAFKAAGINPRTMSFVEAHGTGTALGDPIEIAGLNKVFQQFSADKQYCAIGSAKSSIGHCESAAGIAGVAKVVMQLKHRQIAPSLHSSELNPNIDFANSPFVVQRELTEWKRPVIQIDGVSREYPRIAGISSFGAGGSNAHVIIEEYVPAAEDRRDSSVNAKNPAIIVLSARGKDRLEALARRLQEHLRGGNYADGDLADIAYTLQVGREAMDERLALVAGTMDDLDRELRDFLSGGSGKRRFRNRVMDGDDALGLFADDEDIGQTIETWISKGKHAKLAELWSKGLSFDWDKLYAVRPRIVSLPTYPFAEERCWVPDIYGESSQAETIGGGMIIHPLLHKNTSDLAGLRFSSEFSGTEFFLQDHSVAGKPMLPGVAYLEMARAAIERGAGFAGSGGSRIILKNIAWVQPLFVDGPKTVHIALYQASAESLGFEVYSDPGSPETEAIVHCQGGALVSKASENQMVDLNALRGTCGKDSLDIADLYANYRKLGLEYGHGMQGLRALYLGKDQVLAELSLPESMENTSQSFVLHPSLLDSALQSVAAMLLVSARQAGQAFDITGIKPSLPFAIDSLEVISPTPKTAWAWVRRDDAAKSGAKVEKFDITVCDDEGFVCVRIGGFSSRTQDRTETAKEAGAAELVKLIPVLGEKAMMAEEQVAKTIGGLVLLCNMDPVLAGGLDSPSTGVACEALLSGETALDRRFTDFSVQIIERIAKIAEVKPRDPILVQVVVPLHENGLLMGLSGILRTARLENPRFYGQVVGFDAAPGQDIATIVMANRLTPLDAEVRYYRGLRHITSWQELSGSPSESHPWKDRGVYLLTGGTGGLGLIFAKEIIGKTPGATLVLTGRSGFDEAKKGLIDSLCHGGATVVYRQADISSEAECLALVQGILRDFGGLNGIIHGAGVIADNFIARKTAGETVSVLAPKVSGSVNLDKASQDIGLDFFALFSSGSGVTGNAGQADYAAANAFLDCFAAYRNSLVAAKRRHGHTISFDWPLWKEGGMRLDPSAVDLMRETTGLSPLSTENGLQAFYDGIASRQSQLRVYEGDKIRLQAALEKSVEKETVASVAKVSENTAPALPPRELGGEALEARALKYFQKLVSPFIGLTVDRIEPKVQFEKYGIDSIIVMKLTNKLEQTFGSLPKTLFFEHQNIQELTGYFLAEYPEILRQAIGFVEAAPSRREPAGSEKPSHAPAHSLLNLGRGRGFASPQRQPATQAEPGALDIAIIGLSGRFPNSGDMHEFWENLRDGKDCVTEIPSDRWDHSLYYDADKNAVGKTYSKWGGFLDGVDRFDPLFFNISAREAEFMDPQERLFLQCVHETLEDAGYTREALSAHSDFGLNGNIGVFAGAMYEEYQMYAAQESLAGTAFALSGNPASIANRVSYYFDFHGPSMTVDSMCSSSLTTIHLACQSIRRGECQMAVAGGVNLSVHPNKYVLLGQSKFVSSKGRCESFGEGGDGYVPGEGVGSVLLKPLEKAIADGDRIYGVIKGTAINHGGKTNAYTVPNPNAQASVVSRAFREAGVNPRAVSYIEAHGTGTALGDPIEISGLNKVFQSNSQDRHYCAIGSVKSNIGHCESAAGIAGVAKVLLQIKHRKIVPSLHSKSLNPNIDFENTPFVVPQELSDWKRPILTVDGETREYPRIAGISAFGAGGSNAHVIIEEYISPEGGENDEWAAPRGPVIIALSARDGERLKDRARDLLTAIDRESYGDGHLASLAYTLQTGREGMEERLGFTAASMRETVEKLTAYCAGETAGLEIYTGNSRQNRGMASLLEADSDIQGAIEKWIGSGKHEKLVQMWVNGLDVNWSKLYE